MPTDNEWNNLAQAVACSLQFERLCGREALITEAQVVRVAAEFLQSVHHGQIKPEFTHPDLSKGGPNKRIDLIGLRPQATSLIAWALECKWIRAGTDGEPWHERIFAEIVRLLSLSTNVNSGAYRILLIAGDKQAVQTGLIDGSANLHSGRGKLLSYILPTTMKNTFDPFKVRIAHKEIRPWLKRFAKSHSNMKFPSTYKARLLGNYSTSLAGGTLVYVWVVNRPQKFAMFNPKEKWRL